MREHRLYQADWLIRFYGFDIREIVDATNPMLPLDIDPKLASALRHRDRFPLDINRASREELLRVPGFGAKPWTAFSPRDVTPRSALRTFRACTSPETRHCPSSYADHRPSPNVLESMTLAEQLKPKAVQLRFGFSRRSDPATNRSEQFALLYRLLCDYA